MLLPPIISVENGPAVCTACALVNTLRLLAKSFLNSFYLIFCYKLSSD